MTDSIFHRNLVSRQPFATGFLSNAALGGKLAHAYLLVGRARQDKRSIARDLACVLNCAHVNEGSALEGCTIKITATDDAAVETAAFCQNCRWIWQGKHPQAWLPLANESSKSGKISAEMARGLGDELAKESQFTRMVVIDDASQEIFHRPAANALLKTIEDPKVRCVFLLFATTVDDVLPTVVSRCQVVPLRTTDSLGLSLMNEQNPVGCDPAVADLAQVLVEKHMRRRDAQSVSRLLDFNKQLGELLCDTFDASAAIDLLVAVEMRRIKERIPCEPDMSGYAKRLIELAQSSKLQLQHYVSPKAAMESFTLMWWELASGAA